MEPRYAIMVLSYSGAVFDGNWWRKVFTPVTWIADLTLEQAIFEMAKMGPAVNAQAPCQWITPFDENRWHVPGRIVRVMHARGHVVR